MTDIEDGIVTVAFSTYAARGVDHSFDREIPYERSACDQLEHAWATTVCVCGSVVCMLYYSSVCCMLYYIICYIIVVYVILVYVVCYITLV